MKQNIQLLRLIVLILPGLLLLPITSNAQCTAKQSKSSGNLLDIYFINDSVGLAAGYSGNALRTIDRGNTWQCMNIPTNFHLTEIYFLDDSVGFISGGLVGGIGGGANYGGVIYKTGDAGVTWQQAYSLHFFAYSIHLHDPNNGWAVGFNSHSDRIAKINFGNVLIGSQFNEFPNSIYFANTSNGWIAGDGGFIKYTTNNGQNWIAQNSGTTENLHDMHFFSNSTGWVAGNNGTVQKTSDSGSTWSSMTTATNENLHSIHFINDVNGWAAGNNGTIIQTSDGGNTWQSMSTGITSHLKGVYFTDASNGWAAGDNNVIIHTTDGGNTWVKQNNTHESLNTITFVNNSDGWTAGSNGLILYTTDDGATWQCQQSNTINNLNDILFFENNYGVTVGDYGTILNLAPSASTWQPSSSGINEHLNGLHLTMDSLAWAVGNNGTILKGTYINHNSNWGLVTSISSENLNTVTFSENYGWIAGDNGTLLHTSDHGKSWISQIANTTENLNDIQFIDANNGWAVGNNGTITRTSDGGMNWTNVSSGIQQNLHSVIFADSLRGWITGVNGLVVFTSDGGENWTVENINVSENLNDFHLTNDNKGWIAGDEETITEYIPAPFISGESEVCAFEQEVVYQATPDSGAYEWSVTGGNIVNGQGSKEVQVNWDNTGNGLVIVKRTIGGCERFDSLSVSILANPAPEISGTDSVCEFQEHVTYSVASGAVAYHWVAEGGTITSDTDKASITVDWEKHGMGRLIVSKNDENCTGYDTLNITILPEPEPVIDGKDIVCAGAENIVYSTMPDAEAYSWQVFGGTITSGQNTHEISVNWGEFGNGNVSLIKTVNGCDGYGTLHVQKNDLPDAIISGTDVVTAYTGGYIYESNNVKGYAYEWSVEGGVITDTNDYIIEVEWLKEGTGSVFLTLTDTAGTGCTGKSEFVVSIGSLPTPFIHGPDMICAGTRKSYTLDTTEGFIYDWSVTGGILIYDSISKVSVEWNDPGKGSISVTQSHESSSFDTTFTLDVLVTQLPESGFVIHEKPEIAGIETEPNDTSLDVYEWNFGDGHQSNAMHTIHTYETNGQYTVSLTVTDSNGCKNTTTQQIDITTVDLAERVFEEMAIRTYPNPFNNEALITFALHEPAPVSADLYNIKGQLKGTILVQNELTAGTHTFSIHADQLNLKPGLYVVRLMIDNVPLYIKVEHIK